MTQNDPRTPMLTVEILSRIQFAFCITFHYIYPPLSIGLSVALIAMEWNFLRTRDPLWEKVTLFWLRVFSLTFALGVATGMPLQFALGTNWARYSRFVGDVFGSALAAEGFFAFLIEAGFLGILLFGWNRIPKAVHFMSTVLVSFGAHFSAFWIVVANAWMQTPTGYEVTTAADGARIAVVTDWWAMVFNPSSMSKVVHAILSCWLSGALLIASVSGYYLLKGRYRNFSYLSLKVAGWLALTTAVLHLFSGHHLAQIVAKYQPVKMAAFEGIFETETPTPISVAGWVDEETGTTHSLKVPGMLSLLVHGNLNTPVPGLNDFPREEWPPVNRSFQTYHLMISMWGLILAAAVFALLVIYRKSWHTWKWPLRFLVISVVFPQIANICGWYATCFGRQPWLIQDLLKTSEGYSLGITVGENVVSLITFMFLYVLFFVLFLFLLDKKIKHGPGDEVENLPYRNVFGGDQ